MSTNQLPSDNREKALGLAVATIEKQFGKGSIMRLDKNQPLVLGLETVPTGSISLDIALGVGGLPRGRVIEIFGPESSGFLLVSRLFRVGEAFSEDDRLLAADDEEAVVLSAQVDET